jgi:hypothetical protein
VLPLKCLAGEEMIFDLRKFWFVAAAYALIVGAGIAVVCAGFYAFIGIPTKGFQQVVTQPAAAQASSSKAGPVEIEREVAAPSARPPSPSVHRAPAANIAVAMTPPQTVGPVPEIIVPEPKIIVPEPRSTRRSRPSRPSY